MSSSTSASATSFKSRPENKYTKAKRALRSLAIFVSIPVSLTLSMIFFFGSGRHFPPSNTRPFWIAPLWFFHLSSLSSSFLIGLSSWLVWADGGFRVDTNPLPLYISHISLSLVWNPVILVIRCAWLGFFLCALDFVTLFSCYLSFKQVNPFAKDFIKPCLAWSAYLTAVTYSFMYL